MNDRPCPSLRALVVVAVGMISISARAGNDERAFQQHFAAAVDAYESGRNARKFGDTDQATARFRRAIEEYRLAYEASPQSKALFGTAQAHRALGEMERALHLYEEYLREGPKGPYAEKARTLVPGLREQVERKAATAIAPPTTAPASAPERPAATTMPPTLPLTPPVAQPESATRRASGAVAPPSLAVGVAPQQPSELPRPWYKNGAGWALAGGGLTLSVVGAALFAPAASADDDARRATTVQARIDAQQTATNYRTASYALIGIGGASLIAGVVVFAVVGRSARSKHVLFRVFPSGVGLALTLGGTL